MNELTDLADHDGIPVLAYGFAQIFVEKLLRAASTCWQTDDIREIKALGSCGKKATMNARVNEEGKIERDGNQIEIGGNERYVSLCRKCFTDWILRSESLLS